MSIPECKYIIRKGQAPCPKRSNIFGWTPILAKRDEEFEPFKGDLPPLTATSIFTQEAKPMPPAQEIKKVLMAEAIKKLEKEDFTTQGVPRISALQELLDFEIDGELRDAAYELYLEEKNTEGE